MSGLRLARDIGSPTAIQFFVAGSDMTAKSRRNPAGKRASANVRSAVQSPLAPPRGAPAPVRAEFRRLVAAHPDRIGYDDVPAVTELAQLRCQSRALTERLSKDGATVTSESGATKRHPAIATLAALQVREHRIAVRLGLGKPNIASARQAHVASEREKLARHIDKTFAGADGELLAGYAEWKETYRPGGPISEVAAQMAGIKPKVN